MITGNRIPFVNGNLIMKKALQIISNKKLGILVVRNSKGITTGVITDGQIRRFTGQICSPQKSRFMFKTEVPSRR